MHITGKDTQVWHEVGTKPLVTLGPWTIAEDEDGLRLWQLSHGCQHATGRVTEADLEELQICVRRLLALLADRSGQAQTEQGGQT